jgi:two-component system, OmpR family, sensor histidine kinase VicK
MEEIEQLRTELSVSKKKEAEYRQQAEDLSDFIENGSVPLHWVNGSGIIIWANKAELELLGYSRNEYIGSHISNFHADKDVIEDILYRLVNKQSIRNYPARLKCKNGEIKHVLINSSVYWREGVFRHTRCFTVDITELKLNEAKKVNQILILEEKNKKLVDDIEKMRRVKTFL